MPRTVNCDLALNSYDKVHRLDPCTPPTSKAESECGRPPRAILPHNDRPVVHPVQDRAAPRLGVLHLDVGDHSGHTRAARPQQQHVARPVLGRCPPLWRAGLPRPTTCWCIPALPRRSTPLSFRRPGPRTVPAFRPCSRPALPRRGSRAGAAIGRPAIGSQSTAPMTSLGPGTRTEYSQFGCPSVTPAQSFMPSWVTSATRMFPPVLNVPQRPALAPARHFVDLAKEGRSMKFGAFHSGLVFSPRPSQPPSSNSFLCYDESSGAESGRRRHDSLKIRRRMRQD